MILFPLMTMAELQLTPSFLNLAKEEFISSQLLYSTKYFDVS